MFKKNDLNVQKNEIMCICVYVFFPSWSFQNDSAENFYFLNFFFFLLHFAFKCVYHLILMQGFWIFV